MPGKKKNNPDVTRDEDIAAMKQQCINVYASLGVKKAAAAAVGRELKTVNEWEADDDRFRRDMLGAEYRFLNSNKHKVKLDNVFAHLFDEYNPPTQKVESTGALAITFNYVRPDDQLPTDPETGSSLALPDGSHND